MNIVLVIFDSLRKDCVGAYGSPPWGRVSTPQLDRLAQESIVFMRAYPNVLPTLPARVALYSGQQLYPFAGGETRLRGDFVGAPGWGPIPEDWPTLAEQLSEAGYRTALISDLYHSSSPRRTSGAASTSGRSCAGRKPIPRRSGPAPTDAELDGWLPPELQALWAHQEDADERAAWTRDFARRCLLNVLPRRSEADFYPARVFTEAALWLEQNQDAERFFLTVECFDPHEPWVVPEHYRRMYLAEDGPEQVLSLYGSTDGMDEYLLRAPARTTAARSRSATAGSATSSRGHARRSAGLRTRCCIVAADHGHSLGDGQYLGKRGYPSRPEVFDLPLLVRLPGRGARRREQTSASCSTSTSPPPCSTRPGSTPTSSTAGRSFARVGAGVRDHVTVGWGSAPTVIDERWWLNCKADGSGVFLHDLAADDPFAENVADANPDVVDALFATAVEDAHGLSGVDPRARRGRAGRAGVQPDGGAALMAEALLPVAVVGCGNLSVSRLLPCLHTLPVRLEAVCDTDLGRAEDAARRFGAARAHASHSELLADGGVEAVLVAVGPDAHCRIACDAMEAGCAVFTEKPPAGCAADAERMVATSERTGMICMTGFKSGSRPLTGRRARRSTAASSAT